MEKKEGEKRREGVFVFVVWEKEGTALVDRRREEEEEREEKRRDEGKRGILAIAAILKTKQKEKEKEKENRTENGWKNRLELRAVNIALLMDNRYKIIFTCPIILRVVE